MSKYSKIKYEAKKYIITCMSYDSLLVQCLPVFIQHIPLETYSTIFKSTNLLNNGGGCMIDQNRKLLVTIFFNMKGGCNQRNEQQNQCTIITKQILGEMYYCYKLGCNKSVRHICYCVINISTYVLFNAKHRTDFFQQLKSETKITCMHGFMPECCYHLCTRVVTTTSITIFELWQSLSVNRDILPHGMVVRSVISFLDFHL